MFYALVMIQISFISGRTALLQETGMAEKTIYMYLTKTENKLSNIRIGVLSERIKLEVLWSENWRCRALDHRYPTIPHVFVLPSLCHVFSY